jgi:DnaK suppressor protein
MDPHRARQLVARERTRIEAALAELGADYLSDAEVETEQTGDTEQGDELVSQMTAGALEADLRRQLAAVERAEARIDAGIYGQSVESGEPIPDERLEAQPLAERTADEQRAFEAASS